MRKKPALRFVAGTLLVLSLLGVSGCGGESSSRSSWVGVLVETQTAAHEAIWEELARGGFGGGTGGSEMAFRRAVVLAARATDLTAVVRRGLPVARLIARVAERVGELTSRGEELQSRGTELRPHDAAPPSPGATSGAKACERVAKC